MEKDKEKSIWERLTEPHIDKLYYKIKYKKDFGRNYDEWKSNIK